MWEFLEFLENSSFSVWVRETPTVLLYPTVLACHAFGMAALVGFSSIIALRVLGFASSVPLAPMERFYRLIKYGFWLNLVSGLILLALNPTQFLVMPLFYSKLVAITFAVVLVYLLRASVFAGGDADKRPVSTGAKTLASFILLFWGISIQSGRLTAYAFFPTGWQTITATTISVAAFIVIMRIGGLVLAEKTPQQQAKIRTSTGY